MLLVDGLKKQAELPSNLPKKVVFELVNQYKGRRLTPSGFKPANSTFGIPMRYHITNPNTGVSVEIIYSENQVPFVNGHVNPSFQPEVFSIKGEIIKDREKDAELIYALINSKYCADNPMYKGKYDHELKPIFRIKNFATENKKELERGQLVAKAMSIITDSSKVDEAKLCKLYRAGGYQDAELAVANEDYAHMRAVLQKLAMERPQDFFAIFEDGLADVRVLISDAIKHGVIVRNAKGYVWGTTQKSYNQPLICKIPNGKDDKEAVEVLINFLKFKDDTGVFAEIKKEVDAKN